MTRDEHLAWAKGRALEYLDAGDVVNALASMASDLTKHPETAYGNTHLMAVGMLYARNRDLDGVRRWIEGFR